MLEWRLGGIVYGYVSGGGLGLDVLLFAMDDNLGMICVRRNRFVMEL